MPDFQILLVNHGPWIVALAVGDLSAGRPVEPLEGVL